jgi:NCS1 family nucleobase:cation symporter-1
VQLEQRSIDYIVESERHGKARDLFNVWFGSNMCLTNITVGAGVYALGLNVFWSLVAVVIGNVIGGIFMATHSAQGPKIGIPQMIQSRAQFGVIGAILPLMLALFMYVGFLYYTGLLAAQAIHSAFSAIPVSAALILSNGVTFIITVVGYDLIHKVYKYFTIVSAVVFFILTVVALTHVHLPAGSWRVESFKGGPFLMGISIAATFLLTYAPYVADYSRYLPRDTSTAATFWWTYLGAVSSSTWMNVIGVVLLANWSKFGDDPAGYLAHLLGHSAAFFVYIVLILGLSFANILNLYCAFMSTVTTIEPFTRLRVTPRTRFIVSFVVVLIGTLIAIYGQGKMLTIINDFMLLLQYIMVPWSAINLVDYYLLRHGNYSIQDIFDLDGQYGKFNLISIGTYFLSVFVQIPFMNVSGIYEGPISKLLGHADIAWAVALLLPGLLYYFLMRSKLAKSGELVHFNSKVRVNR